MFNGSKITLGDLKEIVNSLSEDGFEDESLVSERDMEERIPSF